jgi:hypothetical protein
MIIITSSFLSITTFLPCLDNNLSLMVALMRIASKSLLLLPLLKTRRNSSLALGVSRGLVSCRNAFEAKSELGSSTASSLGVEGQSTPVDVVDGVAFQVIARIGLSIGAGEDSGGGDAEFYEGGVVGRFTKLPGKL